MKKPYQIVTRAAKESAGIVEQFCQANGQILLPIVNLIESASQEVGHILHQIQMQTLETILMLSAEQLAGTRTPGKPSGEIRWHGRQAGKIKLVRPGSESEASAFASQDRRGSKDSGVRNAAPGSRPRPVHVGSIDAWRVHA